MIDMKIEIRPTKKVVVLGADRRSVENIAWCAATFGVNRLFWVDGHLLCVEVYEKSLEHEIEAGESDMGLYRNLIDALLKAER